MKIYDIIANESIKSKLFGKAVGKAAELATPSAEKIAAKQGAKSAQTAKFDADLQTLKTVFGKNATSVTKIAYTLGIGMPMVTTAKEILALNMQLNNKEITPAQYEKEVQYWLGKCVTEILAIGSFRTALKAGAGIIKGIPFAGGLGRAVSAMTPAATSAFSVWLATPGSMGGQDAFTKWFVGESFLPGVASVARNWIGSWSKQGYDQLLGRTQQAATNSGVAPKTPAEKELGPFGDMPQPSKSDMQFDPATGKLLK